MDWMLVCTRLQLPPHLDEYVADDIVSQLYFYISFRSLYEVTAGFETD